MFSRRILRIKTLHALYAHRKNPEKDLSSGFEKLLESIYSLHEMYRFFLFLIGEVQREALLSMEEKKRKKFPNENEIQLLSKISGNCYWSAISAIPVEKLFSNERLPFPPDEIKEISRKILQQIKEHPFLKEYNPENPDSSYQKKLPEIFIKDVLYNNEFLSVLLESKNIHYQDTEYYLLDLILKGLQFYTSGDFPVLGVFRDEKDDKEFIETLYKQTIYREEEMKKYIRGFLENWELDRLAEMDLLLIEMCITEFLFMKEIPVKASLNEYIEISKEYSTPNSRIFINGILDRIAKDLLKKGEIQKTGKGLKEN